MKSKHGLSSAAPRKDAAITKRYHKIAIPAVAAAARYQGNHKKDAVAERSKAKSGATRRR